MAKKTHPEDLTLADLQAEAEDVRKRITKLRTSLGRFFVQLHVNGGDRVVSVILATESTCARAALRRVFDRLTQSIRPTAPS